VKIIKVIGYKAILFVARKSVLYLK